MLILALAAPVEAVDSVQHSRQEQTVADDGLWLRHQRWIWECEDHWATPLQG